jgi:uncharacterized RDD family membrane protein YckC
MRPLASRGSRFIAQILDGVVAIAIVCAGVLAAYLSGDGGTAGLFVITAIVIALLYILLSDGMENGQSYGKRAMKIAVVDATTGLPCSYGKSLLRNLTLELLGPIDWLFIFTDKRQRLGDMFANTNVVESQAPTS